MTNVPTRSLDSLLDELREVDRHRRRLLDAIADHPDTPEHEDPLQTVARRLDASIGAQLLQLSARRGTHLRLVDPS